MVLSCHNYDENYGANGKVLANTGPAYVGFLEQFSTSTPPNPAASAIYEGAASPGDRIFAFVSYVNPDAATHDYPTGYYLGVLDLGPPSSPFKTPAWVLQEGPLPCIAPDGCPMRTAEVIAESPAQAGITNSAKCVAPNRWAGGACWANPVPFSTITFSGSVTMDDGGTLFSTYGAANSLSDASDQDKFTATQNGTANTPAILTPSNLNKWTAATNGFGLRNHASTIYQSYPNDFAVTNNAYTPRASLPSNPAPSPSQAQALPCQVLSPAVDAQIGQNATLTIDTPRADIDGALEDLGIPFHTCIWSSPNPQAGQGPTEPTSDYISLGVVRFPDATAAQQAFDQQKAKYTLPAAGIGWPLSSIHVPAFYLGPGPQDNYAIVEMLVGDSIVGIEANVGSTLFNTAPWLPIARVAIDELTHTSPNGPSGTSAQPSGPTTPSSPATPGYGTPEDAVDGFFSSELSGSWSSACSYLAPAAQSLCLAGTSGLGAATGSVHVGKAVVSGTQALVPVTGNICAPTSPCVANSDPNTGMPQSASGFAAAYQAAVANTSSAGTTAMSAVPCTDIGGEWYVAFG